MNLATSTRCKGGGDLRCRGGTITPFAPCPASQMKLVAGSGTNDWLAVCSERAQASPSAVEYA